jgi:hypothetical protein
MGLVTPGCTKRGRGSDANAVKGCRYGIYLCIILESHVHGDEFSVQVGPINNLDGDLTSACGLTGAKLRCVSGVEAIQEN